MITIKNIQIKNFKFFIDQKIEIKKEKKDLLIYGENGTGKSSIYIALYYYFLNKFPNNDSNNELFDYKNRNIIAEPIAEPEVLINFLNKEIIIEASNLLKESIHFLDYMFLEKFISEKDFFEIIIDVEERFTLFETIFEIIENIMNKIQDNPTSIQFNEEIDKRIELDENIKNIFTKIIEYANKIVKEDFKEDDFEISFKFENSSISDSGTGYIFENPKIIIKLNNYKDLRLHFNEAKLKLLSLSIVFAIIKIQQESLEEEVESFKLLVLDDFLSSLDMGNRLYIMKYVFENFKDYQKIILTHNLSFYKIIKRIINDYNKNEWEYKNIYQHKDNNNDYFEPIIFDKNDDYLKKAIEYFDDKEYSVCGNFLRKEVERIISQGQILFEVGKKEKLEQAIISITKLNKEKYFIYPSETLHKIDRKLKNYDKYPNENNTIPCERKFNILLDELGKLLNSQASDQKGIEFDSKLLNKLLFSKDILLNEASHDSSEEYYEKEYKTVIKEVEMLKNIFDIVNKI